MSSILILSLAAQAETPALTLGSALDHSWVVQDEALPAPATRGEDGVAGPHAEAAVSQTDGALPTPDATAHRAAGFSGLQPSFTRHGYVGDADLSEVSDPTAYPYRAAVKLVTTWPNGQVSWCSGTLIGPHHVLTAGHCVYNDERGGWAEIEAIPGYHDGERPYASAFSTNVTSYVGFVTDGSWDYDQAYIALDRNIGDHVGWLGYEAYDDAEQHVGLSLNLNAYPGSPIGDGKTMFHSFDEVVAADAYVIRHELDTAGGSSGGGVYRYWEGERYLQANHATTWGEDDEGHSDWNEAVRLTPARVAVMEQVMSEDPEPVDLPDLELADDAELLVGTASRVDDIELAFAVANRGTATAADASVRIVLVDGSDEVLLGSFVIESLAPFQTAAAELVLPVPQEVEQGTWQVEIRLDEGDDLVEFDEDDNELTLDGTVFVDRDVDGDGSLDAASGGDDCDDDDPEVHPDAEESCNDVDDDCDGEIDEEGDTTWYVDRDQDGYGGAHGVGLCEPQAPYTSRTSNDCDDEDPTSYPGADEICDGVDNDCDGTPDELDTCPTESPEDDETSTGRRTKGCDTGATGAWPPALFLLALAALSRRRVRFTR